MTDIDLNLLPALDALLATGSVVQAARQLGLSASAMSRTLARLRLATGDPLLVRAGRGLVLTPHAAALQTRVHGLARETRDVLTPVVHGLDVGSLDRQITIRASDGFIETFGPRVIRAVAADAPRVRLRFAPKPDKDVRPLRDGNIDLDIGVLGATGPEIRITTLFRDEFVAVVRPQHPLMDGALTPERYVAFGHVVTSRRGLAHGPVDDALAALGLKRHVMAVVPSFAAGVAIAGETDLVALVTRSFIAADQSSFQSDRYSVQALMLPVHTEAITVSMMWHPRFDADPFNQWIRDKLTASCRVSPIYLQIPRIMQGHPAPTTSGG